MSDEPTQEKSEEPNQEQPSEPTPQPKAERPQIVTIQTPLDRPEFDFFLTTFMQKMGLTDRKESAIMLSRMLYDMGLDPYADLKDIQSALQEMNEMLKNLPNTPTTMRVKDTLGGMFAARAGRTMLERFPRVGGADPMMDRMEKLMDKYMPMIMTMRMVAETMSAEPKQKTQQEIPETVKAELSGLKEDFASVREMLAKQTEEKKDRELAEGIIGQVDARLAPVMQGLQSLGSQVDELLKKPEHTTGPSTSQEIIEMRTDLKEAIDKLGEKAGAKQLTLADVDPILSIIDRLQAKFRKEPAGEFDWRTATVSTLGEIGKEAITAYKDVATVAKSSQGTGTSQALPNTEMQAVIRKQVQNYITQRIQTGAVTMNIEECARALALSPDQVGWAYQTLMDEGWINVRIPKKTKGKGAVNENVQGEEKTQTETGQQTKEAEPFSPVET